MTRTHPGYEAVAAAVPSRYVHGSDREAFPAGAPDRDDIMWSRAAGGRLREHYQAAVAGPGHARGFQRDIGRHVGELLPAARARIEQPDVGDLYPGAFVCGIGE